MQSAWFTSTNEQHFAQQYCSIIESLLEDKKLTREEKMKRVEEKNVALAAKFFVATHKLINRYDVFSVKFQCTVQAESSKNFGNSKLKLTP